MRFVESLARETERVGVLLDSLEAEGWAAPTRCPPMDVKEIAAHTWRGSQRIIEFIAAGPIGGEPEKDGVTYFQYDSTVEAPEIVARAQQAASEFATPTAVAHAWHEGWARALHLARETLAGGDPVYRTPFGAMWLSEYLRTRIVEVTIHHMDIRHALLREPDPDPGALEATGDVLRGSLGTDLRPLGIDDVRFVLVGSGRAPLNDDERTYLGPLAEKFPLLA